MHLSRSSQPVQWEKDNAAPDRVTEQLAALNHYQQSGFSITDDAVTGHRHQAELRSQFLGQSAWLQECLHPTPLHYRDDAQWIDEGVQTNCAYRTQLSLQNQEANAEQAPPALNNDPTLLADIVPASQSML